MPQNVGPAVPGAPTLRDAGDRHIYVYTGNDARWHTGRADAVVQVGDFFLDRGRLTILLNELDRAEHEEKSRTA